MYCLIFFFLFCSCWQVRLENKAVVRDGLVCLTPKEVTELGGHVQSLFEEWQMKKKYARLSRSSGRQSQEGKAGDGPPPFEELQIRAGSHHRGKQGLLVMYCSLSFSFLLVNVLHSGDLTIAPESLCICFCSL